MSTTVHVSNISSQTSEHEVRDFFSFCGKITSLSVTPTTGDANSSKSATVTFEKETAAKTALLLDSTQLGASQVKVEAAPGLDQLASGKTGKVNEDSTKDGGDIEQEDKPRSRILAEYMAHGYTVGDSAIQSAIELDKKHGFSHRFTSALSNFDNKVKASDRAKAVDASYGVSDRAKEGWRSLQTYFEKAIETPTGQRVRAFYAVTEKQVLDIHNEARRLADLRKQEQQSAGPKTTNVPGTDKTVCTCAGDSGNCPCEDGRCACQGCAKSSMAGQRSGHTATGPAADVAAATHLNPLGSNLTHEATGPPADFTRDTKLAPTDDQIGGEKSG